MDYSFYASIVVQNAKVAETDANFVVLVNGTYDGTGGEPDIRTVGNGGNVQNTASGGASGAYTIPADLVFSSHTNGAPLLSFEIEKYNAATGEIVAWVQSGVNSGAGVTFYMCFGDEGVTTSQEDVSGTWDAANFVMVHHMNDTTTSSITDSTSSGYDGTKVGANEPNTAGGKIGDAQSFDGGNDYITIGNSVTGTGAAKAIEFWVKDRDASAAFLGNNAGASANWGLYVATSTNHIIRFVATKGTSGTGNFAFNSTGNINDSDWHYIVATWTGDTTVNGAKIYLDGSADGSGTALANETSAPSYNLQIGAYGNNSGPANGLEDEVRISDVVRTADYVTTTYNNQNSPSTFYSVGAEVYVSHRYPAINFQNPGIL